MALNVVDELEPDGRSDGSGDGEQDPAGPGPRWWRRPDRWRRAGAVAAAVAAATAVGLWTGGFGGLVGGLGFGGDATGPGRVAREAASSAAPLEEAPPTRASDVSAARDRDDGLTEGRQPAPAAPDAAPADPVGSASGRAEDGRGSPSTATSPGAGEVAPPPSSVPGLLEVIDEILPGAVEPPAEPAPAPVVPLPPAPAPLPPPPPAPDPELVPPPPPPPAPLPEPVTDPVEPVVDDVVEVVEDTVTAVGDLLDL